MANSTSVQPWTLRMPAGSQQQWTFKFTTTAPGGTTPYTITSNWEYVARTSQTDTGTPLISITTAIAAAGVIVVTASASLSQVALTINPVATATLAPGTYYHTLWMDPGLSTAFTWLTGDLLIAGNPQP